MSRRHTSTSRGTLTAMPAPRPSPRLRRGRSNARAPVARRSRLLAPAGVGPDQHPHHSSNPR
ncbi:hypothetical protein XspCFBP7912_02800 [Xanthomonas sp. CFBP 7912]|nr:hypothetical protein XspCFBP7912_02800 [Xanthomonas sp. CFBP 7912]